MDFRFELRRLIGLRMRRGWKILEIFLSLFPWTRFTLAQSALLLLFFVVAEIYSCCCCCSFCCCFSVPARCCCLYDCASLRSNLFVAIEQQGRRKVCASHGERQTERAMQWDRLCYAAATVTAALLQCSGEQRRDLNYGSGSSGGDGSGLSAKIIIRSRSAFAAFS